jgi:hypothetical protein
MTGLRRRLSRLEAIDQQTPSPDEPPLVEYWLPDNGRDPAGVGRHRIPGTRTDYIVYDPNGTGEQPPPWEPPPADDGDPLADPPARPGPC